VRVLAVATQPLPALGRRLAAGRLPDGDAPVDAVPASEHRRRVRSVAYVLSLPATATTCGGSLFATVPAVRTIMMLDEDDATGHIFGHAEGGAGVEGWLSWF